MTDPIYPWLDPIEVRRLAEGLMRPQREPTMTVEDAGFDQAFVGYATERPALPMIAPPPSPPQQVMAAPAPAPVMSQPEEMTAGPTIARGPFLDRITRFRDWMRSQFSATGIFILDREGAVIFDESNHGRLHFLARSLALASRRQGAAGGNVHVKIGAGATLEVIPVDTAYGCLVLGAVVPDSLPPASVAAVMDALALVSSPPRES
ncbi:MAG: hypothetical protein ABIT37_21975 [Luteolibacter sp.]